MKFWDTSAVVPLLLSQPQSDLVRAWQLADPVMLVWWGSSVEFTSAVARLEREEKISARQCEDILEGLRFLAAAWHEIQPSRRLKTLAERLLRVHRLRSADSLQLAAALTVAGDEPGSVEFLCFDAQLNRAATREGLPVVTR